MKFRAGLHGFGEDQASKLALILDNGGGPVANFHHVKAERLQTYVNLTLVVNDGMIVGDELEKLEGGLPGLDARGDCGLSVGCGGESFTIGGDKGVTRGSDIGQRRGRNKLKGVLAYTKPSSGRNSIWFHMPGLLTGCSW